MKKQVMYCAVLFGLLFIACEPALFAQVPEDAPTVVEAEAHTCPNRTKLRAYRPFVTLMIEASGCWIMQTPMARMAWWLRH